MAWVLSFPYFPGKSSRQRSLLSFWESSKAPCPDTQWLALILLSVGTVPSPHMKPGYLELLKWEFSFSALLYYLSSSRKINRT